MNIDRFHIIVFNHERVCSFLDNFGKIINFDPEQDKIFIIDCSAKDKLQYKEVTDFSQKHGWALGEQIHFIRRKNWGIDQGARIDYFSLLHQSVMKPKYIWQFQEHYLDLRSFWSIWKEGTYNVDGKYFGGQIKGDVIPNELVIDLNVCEKIYETHPQVSVIYADRLKIGIFPYTNSDFFYLDGANFSIRTSYALQAFDQNLLENCKSIYDLTYNWALFMEFRWGFQMTKKGGSFYDLVSNYYFNNPQSLRKIETENNICLHQTAEAYYEETYKKFSCYYSSFANSSILIKKMYQGIFLLKKISRLFKNIIKYILDQIACLKTIKTFKFKLLRFGDN
ncbi:hypothetical protein HW132_25875 [Brasilonema sp. CT11]|nr:hypothetical protein [Brasilonema sp. CT11]